MVSRTDANVREATPRASAKAKHVSALGLACFGALACGGVEDSNVFDTSTREMPLAARAAALTSAEPDLGEPRLHGYLFDEQGFRAIDVPHAAQTHASNVNRGGEIVGTYSDDAGVAHGFLRHKDGSFETLDHPNAETTFLHRINDKGQIVGAYHETASAPRQGFLYEAGRFIAVSVSGAEATDANGINEQGQVAGWYRMQGDAVSYVHGMIWQNGSVKTLDIPERSTQPSDINDAGDVAGFYLSPTDISDPADVTEAAGFFVQDGQTTTFNAPGYPYASANGINNPRASGGSVQIAVGAYRDLSGEGGSPAAFVLWEGIAGPFTSNDVPGADYTEAFDVSDCGQVVGDFIARGEPAIPTLAGEVAGCK